MKIDTNTFSENTTELLFVLTPSEPVQKDLAYFKKDTERLVGYPYESRHSLAHITIGRTTTEKPTQLIYAVAAVASHLTPFTVFIKDCSTFHHGANRTIFLDVVNKPAVNAVTEKIFGPTHANDNPHITIARNLPYDDFLKAWPYFENVHYSQHFTCENITVLQRTGNRWAHYESIPLGIN